MVDHKISFNPLKKETCLYRWTQKLGVAATELGKTPSTTVRFRPFTPKRPDCLQHSRLALRVAQFIQHGRRICCAFGHQHLFDA